VTKKKEAVSQDLSNIELKKVNELKSISTFLDSPDLGVMYTAAGKMMAAPVSRSLLPKVMSLLDTTDATLRKLVFRMAGRNAYGKYIPDLFAVMNNINPAEREQVLQGIEELFTTLGSPSSTTEQKRWISALESLGREHQPTVLGLMAALGKNGTRWVMKKLREHIETISLGSVPKILVFPEKTRKKMMKVLCLQAAKKKLDMLPYICGITTPDTLRFLAPFLQEGKWKDRVQVASTIGVLGISSTSGMVMDIIADTDWRVKQGLLENINIHSSKYPSLIRILGYAVADSHKRVRGLAERQLLLLGQTPCLNSDVETQRKKLLRQYRTQLLRAAPANKDVDSGWLGVEVSEDPIPIFPESEEAAVGAELLSDQPVGVSLEDLSPVTTSAGEEPAAPKIDLMAALLSARKAATPDPTSDTAGRITSIDTAIDTSLPPTDKFLQLLKKLSGKSNRGVSIDKLREEGAAANMTVKEIDKTLSELEKDGIVYRSSKGNVRRADIDL
jgi:hypothetical protein